MSDPKHIFWTNQIEKAKKLHNLKNNEELGHLLNITQQAVSAAITGKNKLSVGTKLRLLALTGEKSLVNALDIVDRH